MATMDWDNEQWFIKQLERMNTGYRAMLATKSAPAGMVCPDGTKAFFPPNVLPAAYKGMAISAPVAIHSDADQIAMLLNELHHGNHRGMLEIKRKAYTDYLRGAQWDDVYDEARMVVLSQRQLAEFVKSGMDAAAIKATMVESQSSLGGFLVDGEISDQVFTAAATTSVVRPNGATVDAPGRNGGLGFPTVARGSQDVYPSALRGGWVSETQQTPTENISLGMIKPEINIWRVGVRVSRSQFEDAGARFLTVVNGIIGRTIGAEEDRSFLVGAGVGQPLGILAQQAAGVLINGDIRVTTTTGSGVIDADSVVNLIYGLPAQYRNRAVAACKADTLKVIRRLKDGDGRYLFDEHNGTLCGVRVAESESMPAIASNAFPLLVGAMEGYAIADRLGLSIEVIQDSRLADTDEVLINVRRRLGGTVGAGYAFAALKVA